MRMYLHPHTLVYHSHGAGAKKSDKLNFSIEVEWIPMQMYHKAAEYVEKQSKYVFRDLDLERRRAKYYLLKRNPISQELALTSCHRGFLSWSLLSPQGRLFACDTIPRGVHLV